jgi:hypothetical protein
MKLMLRIPLSSISRLGIVQSFPKCSCGFSLLRYSLFVA